VIPVAGKAILNYTTSVDAGKTAMECISVLLRHGATNVAISAGEDRSPDGLEFVITTPWGPRQFSLPVNIGGTEKALRLAWREHRIEPRFTTREQARRVAWRIVKDWLEAQLALIEAMQVDLLQVMLPYLKVAPGKTLYAAYMESELRELEAGQ
jgi:hypothetical protein